MTHPPTTGSASEDLWGVIRPRAQKTPSAAELADPYASGWDARSLLRRARRDVSRPEIYLPPYASPEDRQLWLDGWASHATSEALGDL